MKVVPIKPTSDNWYRLVRDSHQGSLYVLPEWIALHPVQLFAAKKGSTVVGGIVVANDLTPLSAIPYQGMLLLRRDDQEVSEALLARVEALPRPVSVWNPPSLVDIRPFNWRFREAHELWQADIRYTYMCDRNSRMERRQEHSITGEEVKEITSLDWFREWSELYWVTEEDIENMEKILRMPMVNVYGDSSCAVVWAVDHQDRGYYIASLGQAANTLHTLIKRHDTTDLVGCNSRTGRSLFKRGFGGHLRTYYGMKLT
jgi:hypothetical protein